MTESKDRQQIGAIFAALEKINHRLDRLESSHVSSPPHPFHPSVEKFSIAEAIADAIFDGVQKEKACTYDPDGKPCDHCSMCSSRGF